MDANPILAETTRGHWVENRHRGAFVVADAQGNVIASAGDIERPIYPLDPHMETPDLAPELLSRSVSSA